MRTTTRSIICLLALVTSVVAKEDLTLTNSQKQKLEKFKEIILPSIPVDWMKEELNLVRYLRTRNWDVRRATDMMKETVRWWKENNMDDIQNENFSGFMKEYPVYIDGVDKIGQPLFAFSFGEWDIRKATVQGKLKKLIRWMFRQRDEVQRRAREWKKQGKSNGTQWNFLVNLDGFNQQQHLCAACLQLYTDWVGTAETHYPHCNDKIYAVNAPSTFEIALSLVRPLFTTATRNALRVLGTNKADWENEIYKEIDRDQLPESFGGTRIYN